MRKRSGAGRIETQACTYPTLLLQHLKNKEVANWAVRKCMKTNVATLGRTMREKRSVSTRVCVATQVDGVDILRRGGLRDAKFFGVPPGAIVSAAAECAGRAGRGSSLFFLSTARWKRLDLQEFAAGYSDEGHSAYHPALLLKVWLYTYALGMTSSRRLEQRIREHSALAASTHQILARSGNNASEPITVPRVPEWIA